MMAFFNWPWQPALFFPPTYANWDWTVVSATAHTKSTNATALASPRMLPLGPYSLGVRKIVMGIGQCFWGAQNAALVRHHQSVKTLFVLE